MKEVEELEMLTQKLMKDMDHPPHAEASNSGLWGHVNFRGVRRERDYNLFAPFLSFNSLIQRWEIFLTF